MFVVATATFAVMFSNDPTPGPYYDVAWWLIAGLLVALVAGVIFGVVRRFARRR